MQQEIQRLLEAGLSPTHLEVINESHMHNVPPNSETHFKVIIVSDGFDGLTKVKCHQAVYALLKHPMSHGVHALALHTFTPAQWQVKNHVSASPDCLGGGK